jgi:hypothetical protein
MIKLRVLVLSFPDFTDISNIQQVSGEKTKKQIDQGLCA